MKRKNLWTLILTMITVVAMTVCLTACGGGDNNANQQGSENPQENESQKESESQSGPTILGEGSKVLNVVIVDEEKNEAYFEIHTDLDNVKDALMELEFIDGKITDAGGYRVTVVNGEHREYEVNNLYWSVSFNGEMIIDAIDTLTFEDGDTCTFTKCVAATH